MVRIVVDIMGGDNAPEQTVLGAVWALERMQDIHLLLAGPEVIIRGQLKDKQYDPQRITIIHAPEVIDTGEAPVQAVRNKRNSSIVLGMRQVHTGEAQGFVSAGSTGAVLASATLILKTIKGINRPALAPLLPTQQGQTLLIDSGANVDCKPINLEQFAVMGSIYMRQMFGVQSPRVGLINIGAEEEKGNELTKTAYQRLRQMPISFAGNIEARDILKGDVDVLVCDAFVGNVVLKFMEGMAGTLMGMIKEELLKGTRRKLGAALAKPAFVELKRRMDYEEQGGAPLLGVNGCVIKTHGSSSAKAIASTIAQARSAILGNIAPLIASEIEKAGVSYQRGEEN